jgi:hypothetical protein
VENDLIEADFKVVGVYDIQEKKLDEITGILTQNETVHLRKHIELPQKELRVGTILTE